ncbi:unnamed protein product [Rotaria socialis]|uniref:Endonuclease/exonuclease/phosphatase domain-containing protein n=1 Tax=Rotaria socialis TaxID=392032 RepID=A0A818NRF4_9BILA|nr:unnamed protein product [Rotaria socialis]
MLKKLFGDNQIPIKELSICVQVGERRFKFVVDDIAEFLTSFNWSWSEEIEDKNTEFIKPHTLPDCYALVVRYIPLDINQDTARQQILKTIPAAAGPYANGVKHSCQDIFNCGQCGGNHYSLDSICPAVKEYREELKLAVDKALALDAIKRSASGEVSRSFQQHENDFPLLNQAKVNSHSAWTTSGNEFLHSPLKKEMNDLVIKIKAVSETMIRTAKSFNDLNNRIEVQHKSTILHCNSICAIIDMVQIMFSWVQDNVLTKWKNNSYPLSNQFIPLNVLTYNVRDWGTRALELMDLIFKVDSPICVFTEVGELWNSFKVQNFTSFYQKCTNHSGGVMIRIGKHLRATRIDTDIENTVIVDIHGLSEQIRIIGIYWSQGQMRNLKDVSPFSVKGTILTGDFNATSQEWVSQSTDRRGNSLKKWIEENELAFTPTNSHSSKRSDRHMDLTFTNLNRVENETIFYGSSDHSERK